MIWKSTTPLVGFRFLYIDWDNHRKPWFLTPYRLLLNYREILLWRISYTSYTTVHAICVICIYKQKLSFYMPEPPLKIEGVANPYKKKNKDLFFILVGLEHQLPHDHSAWDGEDDPGPGRECPAGSDAAPQHHLPPRQDTRHAGQPARDTATQRHHGNGGEYSYPLSLSHFTVNLNILSFRANLPLTYGKECLRGTLFSPN